METVDVLRKYLEDNNITQAEACRRLGCPEATINRWLKGRQKIGFAWSQIIMAVAGDGKKK